MPSTRTLLIGVVLLLLVGVAGAAFAGCTTIRINEEDVFLPKPSITPATFAMEDVELREHMVESPRPVRGATTRAASDGRLEAELGGPRSASASNETTATEASAGADNTTSETSVLLNAWHLTRPDAEGTVLFFGGNGFYLVQSRGYVEALTDLPVNVLMFDYRGYGKSTGEPAVEAFKKDALEMYDFAVDSLGVDPDRLVVHGHSLGTFMASHTARERPVAGVVLENPATDVEGWIDGLAPWFVRLFVDFDIAASLKGESNLQTVRTLDVPLLVLAGAEDQVTRPEMARTLYDEAISTEKSLVVVDSMGHNHLYRDARYKRAYRALLDAAIGTK